MGESEETSLKNAAILVIKISNDVVTKHANLINMVQEVENAKDFYSLIYIEAILVVSCYDISNSELKGVQ